MKDHFLNCADDAFRNATETLQARAKEWVKASPYLFDWIHAQDTVFNNCSGSAAIPAPAPAGSPALLLAQHERILELALFVGLCKAVEGLAGVVALAVISQSSQ
jgi:hypothetical protein